MHTTIENYNSLLRYPIDDACIRNIQGRQSQIVSTEDEGTYVPSSAKWTTIEDIVFSHLAPDSTLYDLEMKAKCKWVGPQGLHPDYLALTDRLAEYYATPLPFGFTLSAETELLLRRWYAPLIGRSWLTPWKEVHNSAVRPTGTSTGYDGFTSEGDMRPQLVHAFFRAARSVADGTELIHPTIAWYRSQRNGMRTIFGVALSTLLAEQHVWGQFVNKWIFWLPSSAYKSNLAIQADYLQRVSPTLPRRWVHPGVFSFEGDFEHMDTGVTKDSATFTVETIARIVGMNREERRKMRRALHNLFNSPLINYDGDVVLDMHSLLSGQLPTNGLEHHIGVLIFFEALVRACKDIGILPDIVVAQMSYKQQGDDSGAILPDFPGLAEALTLHYVEVATLMQQRVNVAKQRVSRESLVFCKNEFAFSQSCPKGWKFSSSPIGQVPVPRYPLLLAWNATLNPESCPPFGKGESRYDTRISAVCSIWDNAFGHPAWAASLNYLWQSLTSECRSLVKSRLSFINDRALKSWEKRVISPNWVSPNSGATVNWISKH